MEQKQAFEKVLTIITPFVKNADILKGAGENTKILEDLGVNSARLVDIILAFEDEFKIEIDDASADRVRTLGDAVKVILEKTA
jgi:acyl carrier protein